MASSTTWSEYNGSGGTTETPNRTEANFKAIDDSTTAYTSSPITAGNNSVNKVQALKFTGTWNSLSALTYKISSNAPGTGESVVGAVVTSAATASATATGDGPMSTTGISANFNSSSSPFGTGTSSTTAGGTMYANALRTQLQTTSSAGPGDITPLVVVASWTES